MSKKLIILLISLMLVFNGCAYKNTGNNADADKKTVEYEVNFTEESDRKTVEVPFEPTKFEAKVKPYKIKEDLPNVVNLKQFGGFSKEQKELLYKNAFFVSPCEEEQLFYIYEKNEYKNIPSFITTDSVLHVYHIFYDYSLRVLENEKLLPVLEELTENMLKKSIYLYNTLKNENLRNIQLKNIAFFGVAQLALEKELPEGFPEKAKELAYKEYELIKKQEGFAKSFIFPFELDYSQYVPRGHYTRSDDLKRYFKALMWYGQAPFPLYDNEGKRTVEQTLQALLITYSVFLEKEGEKDIKLWESLYTPTYFYVGLADDLNIYHYRDLLLKVYGENPDIEKMDDNDKIERVYKEAEKLPEPIIKPKYTSVSTPVGKQFRFLGQRYVPDAEIIQELVEPIVRPVPSGLDVMAVFGSNRAYDIQVNINKEQEKWPKYIEQLNKMKEKFQNMKEERWKSNFYFGWLWTLKGLLKEYGEGYPSFMRNTAWLDKSLSTALGSWAQLKHDTILYGKQSGAEMGGGEELADIKAYVEPNIEVYDKLLWLTKFSRVNLKERGMLDAAVESKMEIFEELLQFLINCSVKELRDEELTEDEYYRLQLFGGTLESLTASFAGDGLRWFEITSETDKNMATIADIHTIAPNQFGSGGYFEVGVGPAYEIYVVVPISGRFYLTRGAIFSYYEFVSGKRLTDEEWQKMIKEGKAPERLFWMKSYFSKDKMEIPDNNRL
ncbi:DUF3160 domain-containing protein [Thermovenabulum sp.]|uniref:DUF3160 domain-containing protein n=1 Tax=Thermovenabulum sp. TaxID=3100335 RepID=UPI003C79E7ED